MNPHPHVARAKAALMLRPMGFCQSREGFGGFDAQSTKNLLL